MLAAPVLAWADSNNSDDCLQLNDAFSALETPGEPLSAYYAQAELLKSDHNATEAYCGKHGLEHLTVTIEQGQRLELRVLVEHGTDQQATASWETSGDEDHWLSLAASESPYPGLSAITLTIDGRGRSAAVSGTVTLRIQDAARAIEHALDLRVEFDEEAPLFRNRFEVEPLPGQFSQTPTTPRRYASITLAALP